MQKNVDCKAPNDPKMILHQQHVAVGGEVTASLWGDCSFSDIIHGSTGLEVTVPQSQGNHKL